jgi:hypothetical protein
VSFHPAFQGNRKTVITGFNTDVEHEGVTYHVQTEDKGLKSPLILSLVYVGGTILASKRTPYEDLIAEGFDEKKLAERLNRQHKLICAAIHTGRIEDLKRQTEREASARAKTSEQEQKNDAPAIAQEALGSSAPEEEESPRPAPEAIVSTQHSPIIPPDALLLPPDTSVLPPDAPVIAQEDPDIIMSESIADFMPPSVFTAPPAEKKELGASTVLDAPVVTSEKASAPQIEQVDYSRVIDYTGEIAQVDDLQISLLDEKRFVAGEFVKINVRVGRGAGAVENVPDAAVTLKVLGSSFRPLIFSGKTAPDGTVSFYAMLPYFTSGRAAILINATNKEYKAELRRVIHQV